MSGHTLQTLSMQGPYLGNSRIFDHANKTQKATNTTCLAQHKLFTALLTNEGVSQETHSEVLFLLSMDYKEIGP